MTVAEPPPDERPRLAAHVIRRYELRSRVKGEETSRLVVSSIPLARRGDPEGGVGEDHAVIRRRRSRRRATSRRESRPRSSRRAPTAGLPRAAAADADARRRTAE